MKMTVRPIGQWPGPMTPNDERVWSPFKASWSETTDLLDREVYMLATSQTEVVMQMAVTERDCRLDGWIRSDARPTHPGVIISFDSVHGPLRYHTDRFRSNQRQEGWQANVRAIALGLEALRKWDRYGLAKDGQQYAGWRQLGSGTIELGEAMTKGQAAIELLHGAGQVKIDSKLVDEIINDPVTMQRWYRVAARKHHPDTGGDGLLMHRLVKARDLLAS